MQSIHKVQDYEVLAKIMDITEMGPIHKAKNIVTNSPALAFVLDAAPVFEVSKKNNSDFISELLAFQKLQSDNLLNASEVLTTENHVYVIFEFPEEMNLQTIIDSKGPIHEDSLMPLIVDLLMAYLPFYKAKALHLNILSKNIYRSKDRFKLLNFPLTQALGTKACSAYFYYKNGGVPSEILEKYHQDPVSSKADVFSIGCVIYEAVMGVVPFSGKDKEELLMELELTIKTQNDFFSKLPNPKGVSVKPQLSDFLERMLQFYPKERIAFADLLQHGFIQSKKKEFEFHLVDYYKQAKYDFENNKEPFKSMDQGLKEPLRKAFRLCEKDLMKLKELDILEVLKTIPGKYGYCSEVLYRIGLLEYLIKKTPETISKSQGNFPYQTRAVSQKALPSRPAIESQDDPPSEIGESDDEGKASETPQLQTAPHPKDVDPSVMKFKTGFKGCMNHEFEIIRFLEDILPTVRQAVDVGESLSHLVCFILSKYLYIRAEFIKGCLSKHENLFELENWMTQTMYISFDTWNQQLMKTSDKALQIMNQSFERFTLSQIKDKKLIPFLNFDFGVTTAEEKTYIRVFLKLVLDFKDLLEKKNQKVLSRFGYGLILRLFYFISIYENLGFFKMDQEGKFRIIEMTQNVMSMDKEKMKKGIVDFLKAFLQKE